MPVQPPDASHVHGGDTERGQVTGARFGGRPILPFFGQLLQLADRGPSMCGRRWDGGSWSALG